MKLTRRRIRTKSKSSVKRRNVRRRTKNRRRSFRKNRTKGRRKRKSRRDRRKLEGGGPYRDIDAAKFQMDDASKLISGFNQIEDMFNAVELEKIIASSVEKIEQITRKDDDSWIDENGRLLDPNHLYVNGVKDRAEELKNKIADARQKLPIIRMNVWVNELINLVFAIKQNMKRRENLEQTNKRREAAAGWVGVPLSSYFKKNVRETLWELQDLADKRLKSISRFTDLKRSLEDWMTAYQEKIKEYKQQIDDKAELINNKAELIISINVNHNVDSTILKFYDSQIKTQHNFKNRKEEKYQGFPLFVDLSHDEQRAIWKIAELFSANGGFNEELLKIDSDEEGSRRRVEDRQNQNMDLIVNRIWNREYSRLNDDTSKKEISILYSNIQSDLYPGIIERQGDWAKERFRQLVNNLVKKEGDDEAGEAEEWGAAAVNE